MFIVQIISQVINNDMQLLGHYSLEVLPAAQALSCMKLSSCGGGVGGNQYCITLNLQTRWRKKICTLCCYRKKERQLVVTLGIVTSNWNSAFIYFYLSAFVSTLCEKYLS